MIKFFFLNVCSIVAFSMLKREFFTPRFVDLKLPLAARPVLKQGITKRTDSTLIPLLWYFPCVYNLWLKMKMWHKLSYACPIIMNFSEDWAVGIIYLPFKFQLHRLINNGNLLSDRNRWKHTDKQTHTDRQPDTDTQT